MSLNGTKVSADLLMPGWTDLGKTCLYQTYDLTDELKPGMNAIGLVLGNGVQNTHGPRFVSNLDAPMSGMHPVPLAALVKLRLEYADGSADEITSDEQWKCASGPITYSSVYGG